MAVVLTVDLVGPAGVLFHNPVGRIEQEGQRMKDTVGNNSSRRKVIDRDCLHKLGRDLHLLGHSRLLFVSELDAGQVRELPIGLVVHVSLVRRRDDAAQDCAVPFEPSSLPVLLNQLHRSVIHHHHC